MEKPEERLVEWLLDHKKTVSTAESCTGGMIASRIVSVPGASACFGEGLVTYSNEAKHRLLGVSRKTLRKYGAVSRETAGEMARGGRKAAGSDCCVAVTGIAGPDGGTKEKPVGLVYIGCSVKKRCIVEKHLFDGDREAVRRQAADRALELARECLHKGSKRMLETE